MSLFEFKITACLVPTGIFVITSRPSIMADKNGNLQFYTNGISINNKKHSTLKNGNRINPGKYLDDGGWTQYDVGGLPLNQGVLSIPSPNDDNKYFVIMEWNLVYTGLVWILCFIEDFKDVNLVLSTKKY